jgi:hypothetical protein
MKQQPTKSKKEIEETVAVAYHNPQAKKVKVIIVPSQGL